MKVYILTGITTDMPPGLVILNVFESYPGAQKEREHQEQLNNRSGDYHVFGIREHEVKP